ncbi:M23 family metallopeptidase [Compostimonas suwonensis]|uniref:Murein DD-endopeptidase MepM/ murein hydrolase activator NlpD n=1 Tax=Compostimonas suwonensis TaxID=1048394 RepID=A0A2M9BCW5_9MICO|nr:M23 family metallopeptidase [Compostimonas suwonensis]PJJ55788.1 murein DD-endopeptidase MepM/ murein hydrolase activator NlpD [Compostimonas suwonensis]
MPGATDPQATPVALTRRELRERERAAQAAVFAVGAGARDQPADAASTPIPAPAASRAEAAAPEPAAPQLAAPVSDATEAVVAGFAVPAGAADAPAGSALSDPIAEVLATLAAAEAGRIEAGQARSGRRAARAAAAPASVSETVAASRAADDLGADTPAPDSTVADLMGADSTAGGEHTSTGRPADGATAGHGAGNTAAGNTATSRVENHVADAGTHPAGRSSAKAAPRPSRRRRVAAKTLSITAMLFVGAIAVATSVPADALLTPQDVQAQAAVAATAKQSTSSEPAQRLDVTGTDNLAVQRDGYESSSVAEIAAATGIRMASDFTNDPNGTIQWPFAVGVHIGDRFGYRDCAGCSSDHRGQDFNPGNGAPIQAIADGVVRYVEDGEGSLGVHVIIDHMIDGQLVSSVYAHMQHGSVTVKEGDPVKVAQVIGKVGSTGMSTGPHLHFEIRLNGTEQVDPLPWLFANTN